MHAPSTKLPPDRTVGPLQRISAEPARELRALGVRWLGHLSYRLADLQPGARRQVVHRAVEVDDELVSGKLPAVAGACTVASTRLFMIVIWRSGSARVAEALGRSGRRRQNPG